MPVLQARETVMRINESSYVMGSMDRSDAASYIRELNVQAQGNRRQSVAPRPKSMTEMMRLSSGSKTTVTGGGD